MHVSASLIVRYISGLMIGFAWFVCVQAQDETKPVATSKSESPPAISFDCQPDGCRNCCAFDFSKTPPIWPAPRAGNFPNPPKGPGYYSLLDQIRGEYRENPPKYGYPPFALMQFSFFNADFRYLDDPKNTSFDYCDPFKRMHLGNNWLFSTGGQVWNRYMNEDNSRLTHTDNNYDLFRVRAYGDLWYQDKFRLYAEFISAHIFDPDLPQLPIDANGADFQNLFIDLKIAELDGNSVYLRVGRQELLYGSQRLISTLDWANTRRTFQGVSALYQSEKWDLSAFWVQPVLPDKEKFDSVDNNQNFAGLWATHRPEKGQSIDLYYLFLDNTNEVTQLNMTRAPYNVHTMGSRYFGDKDNVLWDVEAALQLGKRGESQIVAGMATAGAGYHFSNLPFNPTFWVYYDYATGDSNPNEGSYTTFNQLFPFGHYYLGWADLVGRQNIQDLNAHLYLYPTNWITLWLQYHHFRLAASQDALYNAAGLAIRRDPSGNAGSEVGNEFDLVLNFHLTKHSDLMFGYSKLYGGSFLEETSSAEKAVNSDMLFLLYSYRW